MNRLKNLFGIYVLALTLGGCNDYKPQYLEGKVIKETGTIVKSNDFLFGNETFTFGNIGNKNYNLLVETKDGKYILNVFGGTFGKTLDNLAQEIEIGDSIRVQTNPNGIPCFSSDKSGNVPVDAIKVFKK